VRVRGVETFRGEGEEFPVKGDGMSDGFSSAVAERCCENEVFGSTSMSISIFPEVTPFNSETGIEARRAPVVTEHVTGG